MHGIEVNAIPGPLLGFLSMGLADADRSGNAHPRSPMS
jgi:hypothetical protein